MKLTFKRFLGEAKSAWDDQADDPPAQRGKTVRDPEDAEVGDTIQNGSTRCRVYGIDGDTYYCTALIDFDFRNMNRTFSVQKGERFAWSPDGMSKLEGEV